MARLLSILLLVAGLAAAAFGAWALYRPDGTAASSTVEASAPDITESAALPATDPTPGNKPLSDPITDPVTAPMASKNAETASEPDFTTTSVPGEVDDVMRNMASIATEPPAGTLDTGAATLPVTSEMSASDAFLQRLKTVPVAHETPAKAEYKRAFDVTFAIDATGDSSAADAMPGRGVVETGEARISERVSVRLSGAAFKIDSASPETQVLSPVTENVWRWRALPLTAGSHDLTFEVFAIDQDNVTPLRTYNDTVTVSVSGMSAAVAFADRFNPLFVLIGGLGSALAGAFGVARFFMHKA